jgi:hypothetical protein
MKFFLLPIRNPQSGFPRFFLLTPKITATQPLITISETPESCFISVPSLKELTNENMTFVDYDDESVTENCEVMQNLMVYSKRNTQKDKRSGPYFTTLFTSGKEPVK